MVGHRREAQHSHPDRDLERLELARRLELLLRPQHRQPRHVLEVHAEEVGRLLGFALLGRLLVIAVVALADDRLQLRDRRVVAPSSTSGTVVIFDLRPLLLSADASTTSACAEAFAFWGGRRTGDALHAAGGRRSSSGAY